MFALPHLHGIEPLRIHRGPRAQAREAQAVFHIRQPLDAEQTGAETMEARPVFMMRLKALGHAAKQPEPAQRCAKKRLGLIGGVAADDAAIRGGLRE